MMWSPEVSAVKASRDSFDGVDFSVLLDVGPGRSMFDPASSPLLLEESSSSSSSSNNNKSNTSSSSSSSSSRLMDEKTRAVRAVFRVRERLEAAERELARAAADRELLERRHREDMEQHRRRHALELEACGRRHVSLFCTN